MFIWNFGWVPPFSLAGVFAAMTHRKGPSRARAAAHANVIWHRKNALALGMPPCHTYRRNALGPCSTGQKKPCVFNALQNMAAARTAPAARLPGTGLHRPPKDGPRHPESERVQTERHSP